MRAGLEEAGLDPVEVTRPHMKVMVERVLLKELGTRGVENASQICRVLAQSISAFAGRNESTTSPDDFFNRLNQSD